MKTRLQSLRKRQNVFTTRVKVYSSNLYVNRHVKFLHSASIYISITRTVLTDIPSDTVHIYMFLPGLSAIFLYLFTPRQHNHKCRF